MSRREVKEPVGCEQAPMRDPYHRRETNPVACLSASKPEADSQARCSRQATRKLSPCSPALGHRWGTARIEKNLPGTVLAPHSHPGAQNGFATLRRVSLTDCFYVVFGAGDEIRTHDPDLGKVVLYP